MGKKADRGQGNKTAPGDPGHATGQHGPGQGQGQGQGHGGGHPGRAQGGARHPPARGQGQGPVGKAQPRRRDAVPLLTGLLSSGLEQLPPLGVPLEQALKTPPESVQHARQDLGRVAGLMTLPLPGGGKGPPILPGQTLLSYLLLQGLLERGEMVQRSGVNPTALALGTRKADIVFRGKRLAILGQNLAADGRLLQGARFTFHFKRLLQVYQRRLQGPPDVALGAVAAFGKLDAIRFRMVQQIQAARDGTAGHKAALVQTIDEKRDEQAFRKALELMRQKIQPDKETLVRAARHANRVQEQHGLGLAPAAAPQEVPQDLRSRPR